MQTLLLNHWHHDSRDAILTLRESDDAKGPDTFEMTRRQSHIGPTQLSPKKARGPYALFLLQFHQPLVYILLAAVAITLVLGERVDSSVILAVVLASAIVGFVQESKAMKAIEALARSPQGMATVVLLQSGDKVPTERTWPIRQRVNCKGVVG